MPKTSIIKWAVRGCGAVSAVGLLVASAVTGNRMLLIAAAGIPAVFGAAFLAITYGQRHSYG